MAHWDFYGQKHTENYKYNKKNQLIENNSGKYTYDKRGNVKSRNTETVATKYVNSYSKNKCLKKQVCYLNGDQSSSCTFH